MAMGVGGNMFRLAYDIVKQVGDAMQSQQGSVQQTNQKLQSVFEQLKGGDWEGEGAQAFFTEMDEKVMPAMKRLADALSESDRVSKQIEKLAHEGEQAQVSIIKVALTLFLGQSA